MVLNSSRRIFLFGILVFGGILRLITISQSLWLDEASSVINAQKFSYPDLTTKFSSTDFHPPLYYLFLKFWMTLFGSSEIIVRLPSVIFGVASVWLVYLIGKKIWNEKAGIVAAILLAINPLHVYYSQEARMYSLETLLVLISVYLFLKLFYQTDEMSRTSWIGFTVTNMLLIYTDYLPILIFLPMTLFVIFYRRNIKNQQFLAFFVSIFITFIAFLPFLPIFLSQLAHGHQASASLWSKTLGFLTIKSIPLLFTKFLIGRISFENNVFYMLYVVFGVILAVLPMALSFWHDQNLRILKLVELVKGRFWRRFAPQNDRGLMFIALWLFIPLLVGSLVALKLSIFDYFRFLFVLPAFVLLIAFSIIKLPAKIQKIILLAFVLYNLTSLAIYYTNTKFHREDWRSAVHYIETNTSGNAITIFVNPDQADAYRYYLTGKVPVSGPIDPANHRYQTIYLLRYVQDIFDPEDTVKKSLEQDGYKRLAVVDFNRVIIWQYGKP